MNRLYLFRAYFRASGFTLFLLLAVLRPAFGQSDPFLLLKLPDVSGQQYDTITVPVAIKTGPDELISFYFNLSWDPDALQVLGLSFPNGNPFGLSNANFNLSLSGILRCTWFDQNAIGVSIPDETVIFELTFRIVAADPAEIHIAPITGPTTFINEIVFEPSGEVALVCQVGRVFANMPAPQRLNLNQIFVKRPFGSCAVPNGEISLNIFSNGTPPYAFSWAGPGGFQSTSSTINNLSRGMYDLLLTDAASASSRYLFFLGEIPLKLSGQAQATSCIQNDGTIKLSATTNQWPISYAWSNGATTKDIGGLSPGLYTVTATDAGSCARIDSFEVLPGNSLLVDVQKTHANCANSQQGTALAVPQNGQAPFGFYWSDGEDSQLITGLFSGIYTVTVTDATGCTGTTETFVADATVLAWDLYLYPACGGPGQSALLLRAGDPAALQYPLTVSWSAGTTQIVPAPTGDTLAVLQMIPSGVYTLTITDSGGCGQVLSETLNCFGTAPLDSATYVWPGDTDNNSAVNHHDLLFLGLGYGANGPARPNASLDWTGQPAPDWPQNTGGLAVNYKNLDANGDGLIDAADTLAIAANWGQVIDPDTDDPFGAPQALPGMGPTPAPALALPADTLFAGQSVFIPVVLGSAAAPAENLHGLAFSISYDPKILRTAYFEPEASWLGDPAAGLLCLQRHFPGQNRIDVALSRTDGQPAGGHGIIGKMFIIIEDDIFFKNPVDEKESGLGGSTLETTLFVRNIRARTPANTQPEIKPENARLVISQTVGVKDVAEAGPAVQLAPNPVSEVLRISCAEAPVQAVFISNLWGQAQYSALGLNAPVLEVPVQDWARGAYVARVFTGDGVVVRMFVVK